MFERVYFARDSPGRTEKSVAPALATIGRSSTAGAEWDEAAAGSAAGAVSPMRGGREASAEAYLESGNPRPRPRRRRERRPRSPPRSGRSPPRSVRSIGGAPLGAASFPIAPLSTSRSWGGSGAGGGAIDRSTGGLLLSPREDSPREDSPREDSPRPGSRSTDTRSKSSVSSEKSETYRNVSRSRPKSTKADCMPGKT